MEVTVPGFEAAERFLVGTIALTLVPLWLLAVGAHLAGPYTSSVERSLGVRLAGEMWGTLSALARNGVVLLVFLASFITYYPDVMIANDFPITGGVAATLALAVLTLRLLDPSPGGRATFRAQAILLGFGAALYVVPYVLATQLIGVTQGLGPIHRDAAAFFVGSRNPGWALALCAVAQEAAVIVGAIAIVHTLRTAPVTPKAAASTRGPGADRPLAAAAPGETREAAI